MVNKKLLIDRFSRSINTYDENALIQSEMALKLYLLTQNYVKTTFPKILEIGCGTGLLTKFILGFRFEKLYTNDIVSDFETKISQITDKATFISSDAEKVKTLPENLDLVISSASFQWFDGLDKFLKNIYKNLNKDGYLIFSTFGYKNIYEIANLINIKLNYNSKKNIIKMLKKYYYIIHAEEDIHRLKFPTALEALHNLKLTGTNAIEKTHWTKNKLLSFLEEYENKYKVAGKVPLTYNPIYFIVKKKPI